MNAVRCEGVAGVPTAPMDRLGWEGRLSASCSSPCFCGWLFTISGIAVGPHGVTGLTYGQIGVGREAICALFFSKSWCLPGELAARMLPGNRRDES
jgi:hypothetical protein